MDNALKGKFTPHLMPAMIHSRIQRERERIPPIDATVLVVETMLCYVFMFKECRRLLALGAVSQTNR